MSAPGPKRGLGLPERADDEIPQGKVAALADSRDKDVVVVSDQAKFVQTSDAPTHFHGQCDQLAGDPTRVYLDLGSLLSAESARVEAAGDAYNAVLDAGRE